jgi:hypothetical protein
MTNALDSLSALSDADLLIELRRSVVAERTATAHLIEVLAEMDARRLYLAEGCSALFTYCTQVLHLSEHAAYKRITAARVGRRIPAVLEALRNGDVTLTTISLLAPHLTPGNSAELLAAARHKSKREVEQLAAALAPKPDVPASVRKLPMRGAGPRQCGTPGDTAQPTARLSRDCVRGTPQATVLPAEGTERATGCSEPRTQSGAPESAPAAVKQADGPQQETPAAAHASVRPAVIAALAPERYKIQFTASRELHDRLRRAQDLLRHAIPAGDVAAVVDRALTLLVEELERRKLAAVKRPHRRAVITSKTRSIPAAVKRIVWTRDGGRCTFVGAQGRCTERGFLDVHHILPFAAGGETRADNLALRCRAHNQFESEQFFGPLFGREARAGYEVVPARSGASW